MFIIIVINIIIFDLVILVMFIFCFCVMKFRMEKIVKLDIKLVLLLRYFSSI